MVQQKLRVIGEKMKTRQTNLGLVRGKMGYALFCYLYAHHIDPRYEEYAHECLDEIIEGIGRVHTNYVDGLSGIGTGIEYLVREALIEADTNEILRDFDKIISRFGSLSPFSINMRTGIIGYGTYYFARLSSSSNNADSNYDTEFLETKISDIVDLLSIDYFEYRDLFFIIGFLPNIIRLNINKEKACIFFNYAVDLLETMVYEDVFF